ncbi:hypothetical protein GCM10009678_55080 [Actinomadura kijaniata]|uniref:Uncharacterized protein n=1 Tax=Actinomadura namibiensis TaxID=182080 RepID=A0A7W3QKC9_ACTNM|nr:hypothetical protein [Actinomadura namibiensis]MBA8950277.1 hypothetical protein [Actinomadura namibiensis]
MSRTLSVGPLSIGVAGALLLSSLSAAPAVAAGGDPVTPVITLAAAPTSVDPEHPTAAISGKVTARETGAALPGVPVDLSTSWGDVTDATTGDDGSFTATLSPTGEQGPVPVTAHVVAAEGHSAGQSEPVYVAVRRGTPEVTLKADRSKVDEGQPVTFTGTVAHKGTPLANLPLTLDSSRFSCGNGYIHPVRLKTDANGEYRHTAKALCGTDYTVVTAGRGFYESGRSAALPLAVRQRSVLSLSASLSAYGEFNASGGITVPTTSQSMNGKKVVLEHSYDGKTGWKAAKTLTVKDDHYFSTKFRVNNSGHWRVRFAGDASVMPATSPVRKTWRWNTRMSKISVSPKSVRKNRYTTVRGTLTRYWPKLGRHSAYGGKKIRVIFRFKGKKTWYHAGWATTDGKGRYTRKLRAYGDGYFAAVFAGTSDTWASETPNDGYVNTYSLRGPGDASPLTVFSVQPPPNLP